MADLKLVGAVAIKVRPDASGFRKSTQKQVSTALSGVKADVEVDANVNTTGMEADVEKAKKEIEAKIINLKVGVDYDSIRRAQEQLKRAIQEHPTETIKVNLDDPDDVIAQLEALQNSLDDSEVHITYVQDEKGYKEVLAKIAEIRRQKLEKTIQFDVDEDSPNGLRAKEAEIKALLGGATVATITFEYDMNPAGLAEARAKLRTLLGISDPKITIDANLDASQLMGQLALVDRALAAEEAKKRKIKFEADMASYIRTLTAIAFLTRDQKVTVAVHLRDNTFLVAAKLLGLRAAARWTEEFARAIGTLDRNLPIVAAATLAISALSAGVLTLVGDMFSLGNGLGQVIRMGALLAPAMISGLGAIMIVLTGVFKDFGAAVNGDQKAIKKLSDSGRTAAAEMRVHFQDMRETISSNFWDKAGDSMLNFVRSALPAVTTGFGKLAGSMGTAFGGVLDSFTRLAKNDGISVFFGNLARGFDVAGPGIANFFDAFNRLAVLGSTVFPRLGKAFNEMSDKFINWVNKVAADGSLQRWIDMGIEGMGHLWDAGVSLVKVWGNIGQAAQAAGALTLGSFSAMLDRLDKATAGARFQQNMKTIFAGARDASDAFHKSLGNLGPAMDRFSKTIAATLVGSAKALGAFIADVGDVMSSPRLTQGITAFTDGLASMFVSLRPAAGAVADILGTLGEILGTVATDSGPLFRDLFINLAGVLDTAWAALEPFLPGLIEIGQAVINTLGPVFTNLARVIIPAFARGLTDIGQGIGPIVKTIGDLAAVAAVFITSLPVADIVGITVAVLALGGAMQFAGVVVPIAVAALNTFRTAAAITATTTALLVPGIGLLLAVLTGFTAFAVTSLATSQENATPRAAEYAAALEEDAKAAGHLSDELGKATTKVALHDLATSGAYDAASKLGISHQQLSEAVLEGGDALKDIRSRTKGAISAYDEASASALLLAFSGEAVTSSSGTVTKSMAEQREAAIKLDKQLNQTLGTIEQEVKQQELWNKVKKDAGILTDAEVKSQKELATQTLKSSEAMGMAAAASRTLQDQFAGSAAKVDAMRKTFELLLGPNTKQQAADATGAYVKGFFDILEAAKAVRPEIEALGDAAFGDGGFLNTASGNAAVLQLNQALISQVDNTWAAAKQVYDNTLRETGSVKQAFEDARKFIDGHHGDFNRLAEDSGVSAEKVQGQWEAVFGHDWVLKVSLAGATEAALAAEQLVKIVGGTWDGQKFMADFDVDPTLALLNMKDPVAAAEYWVNKNWMGKLRMLPDEAMETLRKAVGMTEAQWDKGDFAAILSVAKGVPGLAEALQDINNGIALPFYANIFARLNGASYTAVLIALGELTLPRTVAIGVAYTETGQQWMGGPGKLMVPQGNNGGIWGRANGGLPLGWMKFANGGFSFENHVAQIARPGVVPRVWAEKETHGEAYIPYAHSKRPRSTAILNQVARDFGYSLSKATEFVNGGTTAQPMSTNNTASVHIGQLITADPDSAVRKIRTSQQDALAVAGMILNGA